MSPTPITVALDWSPNTNHTGFYIAKAQGLYADAGLDVKLLSPHVDEYKTTPASRVEDGTATFAICPSESVISFHTHPGGGKPKIQGVAAVLADSTSAVVTLASSGLDRPAKLDGKTYASYGARYEGRIVQQMIVNDGGKGTYTESTPPMLGIWNTLLKGEADATWVFMGWEGVEAKLKGLDLNAFGLEQYKIPYGYSPLLVAHPDTLRGARAEPPRPACAERDPHHRTAVMRASGSRCVGRLRCCRSKQQQSCHMGRQRGCHMRRHHSCHMHNTKTMEAPAWMAAGS
mmetsp:Transcript_14638/g.42847  ORF Transcript_14638/g.42847 Transcript_14638/m.42847 type:complete len:288 (-) Transcript_14638:1205-2068(-)